MTQDPRTILRRPLTDEEAERHYRPRNVAKLLTRLQPRSPSIVPRKGSSGYREPWEIEDGITIAGALGAVAAQGPGPAFAVTVLCLRWWPEYVFGPELVRVQSKPIEQPLQAKPKDCQRPPGRARRKDPKHWRIGSRVGSTTLLTAVPLVVGYGRNQRVVRQDVDGKRETVTIQRGHEQVHRHPSFRPALRPLLDFANLALRRKVKWDTIPKRLAPTIHRLIDSGAVVAVLMDEYVNPNHCPHCRGYGQDVVIKEVEGRVKAVVVDCPACIGSGHQPWGVARRAKAVGLRAANFKKYLAPSYGAVLGIFRSLEGRAARSLVRVLGD